MKHNGIISAKISTIEERILKINQLLPLNVKKLEQDYFLKSGIERTLQVCIEAIIDIANRIICIEGFTPSATSFDSIRKLQDLGLIQNADYYKPMIQFRNLVVQRYESIDSAELVNIYNNHLNDFKKFISEIK